jgi:hypothetical protein
VRAANQLYASITMKRLMQIFSSSKPELAAKPELGVFGFHCSVAIRCLDCDFVTGGRTYCTICGSSSVVNVQKVMDRGEEFVPMRIEQSINAFINEG